MATFRSSRWVLAGAAVLLLAHSPCKAQEKQDRRIETKVIVVDGQDADHHERILRIAGGRDLECTEENGRKVCIAKVGHGGGFAGTFLGVHLTDSTPELREHLGGPSEAGVLVSKIEEESPAAEAGIRVGDIVTAVEGEPVESARDLRRAIASRDAGDAVTIELYRDGRLEQVTATLARREPSDFLRRWELMAPAFDAEELSARVREALEGIDLEDLDAQVRRQLEAVDWEQIRESVREALDRALEKSER